MSDTKTAPATKPNKIRLTDLAAPLRTPEQQQAFDYGQTLDLDFSEDSILAEARGVNGLADFGAPDFLERLRVWSQSVREDVELSGLGRLNVRGEMVRFAANRLLLEDFIKRHPQIEQTPVSISVAVAGLPRSGTTYLLALLAGDPNSRSLPYWEAVRPVAWPFVQDGVDTRRELCAAAWARTDALLPVMKMIHEFTPDHISEDVELSGLDFGSYYLEWLCRAPAWRDWGYSHDQTSIYRYIKRVMQVLSFQRGPSRWVTKCPQHMELLPAMHAAAPEAVLAINHRDPVASIQSAITGIAYGARVSRTRVDMQQIAEYWVDRYEHLLRACVRDRDLLPDAQCQDVYFHELMADPMGTLRAIYRKADLEFDAATQQNLRHAIDSHPRAQHGQLVYNLREDFGLEPEAVRERFDFYFKRFPVQIEVK